MNTLPPLFDTNATATLNRVSAVFTERGQQYADTWRNARWLAMLSTARQLGITITADQCRKLAAAALVDVKYARLEGGYKDDTAVDMIAYLANWTKEMEEGEDLETVPAEIPCQCYACDNHRVNGHVL